MKKYIFYLIIFWILQFVSLFIIYTYLAPNDSFNPQNPLFEKLLGFSPLFILINPLFFAPIIEEFVFRYWTKQQKYAYFISIIGLASYSFIFFQNLIFSLIVLISSVLILFKIKNSKYKNYAMMIFSSLLFAIIHIGNYNTYISIITAMIFLFIFSLILVNIGLKFKFYYCIIFHFINNSLALLPMILFNANSPTINFENTTYKAQLKSVSIFSYENTTSFANSDSINFTDNLSILAKNLQKFDNEIIYKVNISNLNKHHLIVKSKNNKNIAINELTNDLIIHSNIESDTISEKTYTLNIQNQNTINNKECKNCILMTLYDFINMLRNNSNIFIKMDSLYVNSTLKLETKLINNNNINEIRTSLKNNNNIIISEEKNSLIKIVAFQ